MQDYSHIVAPFDGIVTFRYADTGALIQSGTSNVSSMPVVKVAQVNVLRLRIPVPESIAAGVRIGDTAQVRVQASGEKFPGKVARFTGSLDRSTRTMQVEIDVPNNGLQTLAWHVCGCDTGGSEQSQRADRTSYRSPSHQCWRRNGSGRRFVRSCRTTRRTDRC